MIPTELVCQHGRSLQNCSICHPRQVDEIEATTIEEKVQAARPRLLHLAHLLGVGPDEAEDVVQETFLEAWRNLPKLREPQRLSSWLDGICRNICRRHLHARSSMPQMRALDASPEEGAASAFDLPDPLAIDPVEELERQEMQMLLDRALSYLPESPRELIELCYLVELPQREVAQQLGISLGALELKLHRARRQLHQLLHGELREDALACGLSLNQDQTAGWQGIRHWCFICGKQALRWMVEQTPTGVAILRLRCPECSSRYHTDLVNTGHLPNPDIGPIHSVRPAAKRYLQAVAIFYQTCLEQRQCPTCHSLVQIQIVDRRTLVSLSGLQDVLPLGVYARVDCPSCGSHSCEAYLPLLRSPTIRDFLLRPHTRYEPASFTTYQGSDAIRFRLLDLSSTETLTVLAHPQTLQLLATIQN